MKATERATQATAMKRTSRSAGSRSSATRPAIQTGASGGLARSAWKGTMAHQGSELAELPAASERDTSICGQPWSACHTIQGDQTRRAMPAPSQILGVRHRAGDE